MINGNIIFICDALCNLLRSVQSEEPEKHPWWRLIVKFPHLFYLFYEEYKRTKFLGGMVYYRKMVVTFKIS